MKKYLIEFLDDYLDYEKIANSGDEWFRKIVDRNPDALLMCKKWSGKSISIIELEELIGEFGSVTFDGETIQVLNGHG